VLAEHAPFGDWVLINPPHGAAFVESSCGAPPSSKVCPRPATANLTAAQLAGDQKKGTIQKNSSDVWHLVFEKNVDTNLSHDNSRNA